MIQIDKLDGTFQNLKSSEKINKCLKLWFGSFTAYFVLHLSAMIQRGLENHKVIHFHFFQVENPKVKQIMRTQEINFKLRE
jgi:hypothetical protein